ncbi:gephyrin-like molybdotransferase Glp [Thiobacter sp. AK1]|uniref:Molybdopterin molybdenumtransferase n=2 Tax=Thiobacter aerophilum TaxID=3121275 RepID=A0ABV0EDH4_9BURK
MSQQPMLSVDEALDRLLAAARPLTEVETVATEAALGRTLAQSQVSPIAVPPLDNSAMDGYAVRVSDLNTQGDTRLPVSQRILAGSVGVPLAPKTAARIFTGAPIPPGADAVVMQEDTTAVEDGVTVHKAVTPGAHIRRAGEDIAPGATVLSAGTRLFPQHLGLAASVGLAQLPVVRRLRVATFFTGDELVAPGMPLEPGRIYNSNRYTINGLATALGFEVVDLGTVRDDLAATMAVLARAAQCADVVITSGGVSVGEADFVKAAVERQGRLDMWRIAVKPGKPLAFGEVAGKPFIGLPGNPVSVFVTFCLFARPFLLRMQGVQQVMPAAFWVEAAFDWPRPDRRREFLRARLVRDEEPTTRVEIYPHQGSGVLTSTVWGDGLVDVPAAAPVRQGERVRFIPFAELMR